MRLIQWTVAALGDLRAIDRWLERETTPDFAVATLASIRERAQFLRDFPHGGRPERDDSRILRVFGTPYLIRCRICGNQVDVIRVHYEREDWLLAP